MSGGTGRRGTPKLRIPQVEAAGVPVGKRFVNARCVVGAAEQAYLGFNGRCRSEVACLSVLLCISLTLVAGVVLSVMSLVVLATELNADEE